MKVLKVALPERNYTDDRVGLKEAFSEADIVTLHCPLTEATEALVNEDLLDLVKPSSILINTARGPLINEAALATALKQNKLAHAYLDVLSQEPPSNYNPLLDCPNVTITPHLAWATREARERLVREAVENLKAWKNGVERNVVA